MNSAVTTAVQTGCYYVRYVFYFTAMIEQGGYALLEMAVEGVFVCYYKVGQTVP